METVPKTLVRRKQALASPNITPKRLATRHNKHCLFEGKRI
jgi:hypothetical protein